MNTRGRWAAWGDDPPEPDHKDIDGWAALPPPSQARADLEPVTLTGVAEALVAWQAPEWMRHGFRGAYAHPDGHLASVAHPQDGVMRLHLVADGIRVEVINSQVTKLGEFTVPTDGGVADVVARILEVCLDRWFLPPVGSEAWKARQGSRRVS